MFKRWKQGKDGAPSWKQHYSEAEAMASLTVATWKGTQKWTRGPIRRCQAMVAKDSPVKTRERDQGPEETRHY